MDIFIHIVAGLAILLLLNGARILFDRSREIGALLGLVWIICGLGFGALAAVLWAIMHLSIHTV